MRVDDVGEKWRSFEETALEQLTAQSPELTPRPFWVVSWFLVLVFGTSWLIEVPAALTKYGLIHLQVSKGLQTLAQLTPALAALITAGVLYGRQSLRFFLAPLFKMRVPWRWYLLVFLLPPLTQAAALLSYKYLGHSIPKLGPWYELFEMASVLSLFSVGEELGWRGFLLPVLARRNSLFAVTAWMAVFWGSWHLPFYFAISSEGENTLLLYLLFLAGILPVSAFFVLLYSRTASVFLCIIFHGSLNAGAAYFFGSLGPGQLLPYGLWVVLLWIAAVPVFSGLARDTGRL